MSRKITTPEHIRFPSINQFRNVIEEVQTHHNGILPVLKFRGTVKLHGTNAAVCRVNGEQWFQSRSNIIKAGGPDNAEFALWADAISWDWLFDQIPYKNVVVFGEWCGGNIQAKVALNGLPKMFVIFKILADGNWLDMDEYSFIQLPEQKIYNIHKFQTWEIEIDFNSPQEAQNILVEITKQIEKECPVGKVFGHTGTGEGAVWTCVTPGYNSFEYIFKAKGSLHSATRTKVIASIDTEKFNSISEFVSNTVTEARLNQGIDYLKEQNLPINQTSTGVFLKWLVNDIMKEEADTMRDSMIVPKDCNCLISKRGREWFFSTIYA